MIRSSRNVNQIGIINVSNTNNILNLKYLFHNVSLSNKPKFSATFNDKSNRSLSLTPLYKGEGDKDKLYSEGFLSSSIITTDQINGLQLEYETKQFHTLNQSFKSSINYSENGGIVQKIDSKYKENINAIFITSDLKIANVLSEYSDLVKRKMDTEVLKTIQAFDNKIEAIQALPDGIYLNMKGIDELVPLNMAGDGLRRYLMIMATAINPKHSIVLIDEIENGLHYSAYKLLWKSILSMSKSQDAQLFITTHNVETLQSLKSVLEEEGNQDHQDSVKVFTIEETKKSGFQTYGYSYEGFKEAIDNEMELRG